MLNNYQGDLMSGKGDKPRDLIYTKEYRDNFDRIFNKKKPTKDKKDVSKDKRKR